MKNHSPERYRETLIVEKIATLLGFGYLAKKVPGRDPYPPYLFYGFSILFELGVIQVARYLSGRKPAILVDPFWIAIPLGVILAIISVRYMADRYAEAIAQLRVHDRIDEKEAEQFKCLLPMKVKLSLYAVTVILFFSNDLFNVGLSTIIEVEGLLPALLARLFVIPLGYLPLMIEFVLLYFSIHVLLPRRIASTEVGLFFYDPRNMGGFAPIGQLLKRTYYVYTAVLILYFLFTYGSTIASEIIQSPLPEPGLVEAAFFSFAWLVGLASMTYSMYTIHRVMVSEKQQHIREFEEQLLSAIDDPYNIKSAEITDPDTLEDSRQRLEQVRATKEYPTTFTMWTQILISVFLPQALNMAVQMGI
ncbi:hypothetical protein [Salinibaculum rarum]|uniref:hypothetical protein n=1 Tax=Salinibaculum rarum TaxID=3058903 RepID=UPI00265EEA86|nr:hypothetical protein [Salinibaculum sp. KK48]